jgi:hypothetical protein
MPADPYSSLSASLGSSVGSGLRDILGTLIQRQRTQPALQAMGMGQQQANALGGLDPRMLSIMLGQMGRRGQSPRQLQQTMSGLVGLGYSPEEAMQLSMLPPQILTAAFRSRGFLPGKMDVAKGEKLSKTKTTMKSKKLTNKVVDHFLKKSGGDPTKARALAKKAGYKV